MPRRANSSPCVTHSSIMLGDQVYVKPELKTKDINVQKDLQDVYMWAGMSLGELENVRNDLIKREIL